jgi:hypothetical protein
MSPATFGSGTRRRIAQTKERLFEERISRTPGPGSPIWALARAAVGETRLRPVSFKPPHTEGRSSMEPQVSTVERAFQLTRSGRAQSIAELKGILRKEGYPNGHLDNVPALSKQLRSIMEAARPKPSGQPQRSPD